MKKLMCAMMALIMLTACSACGKKDETADITVTAEPVVTAIPEILTEGDFEYILLEDGTAEITGYNGETEKLKLPEKLGGVTVTSLADLGTNSNIEKVIIPDCITQIKQNPFSGCFHLKKIKVSAEHDTLAVKDEVLFDKNEKRLICYPSASDSTVYEVPDGIQVIDKKAFYNCDRLKEITLPDSVTMIDDRAFSGCMSLKKITLPESVMMIGEWAFNYCTSLKEITLPDSITIMGANPFQCCSSLNSINVSPENEYLAVTDGVLFGKTDNRLITYLNSNSYESYEVPIGTKEIDDHAFYCCNSLREITLPDGVTMIGEGAFCGCANLNGITLPESVTMIGEGAFCDCESLKKIKLPEGITAIGDSFFSGCESLSEITLPDSITMIGDHAFCYCESLSEITLPESITTMGVNPFKGCGSLNSIYLSPENEYLTVIDGVLFSKQDNRLICYLKNKSNTSYDVPDGIEIIDNYAFGRCKHLKEITLPDSVTVIGEEAFSQCKHLKEITLPEGVTVVSEHTFYGCKRLKRITLPDSITTIDDYSFMGCESLKEITLPESVTMIGEYAFKLPASKAEDEDTDSAENLCLTVERDSYAEQYAIDNGIKYIYSDSLD